MGRHTLTEYWDGRRKAFGLLTSKERQKKVYDITNFGPTARFPWMLTVFQKSIERRPALISVVIQSSPVKFFHPALNFLCVPGSKFWKFVMRASTLVRGMTLHFSRNGARGSQPTGELITRLYCLHSQTSKAEVMEERRKNTTMISSYN